MKTPNKSKPVRPNAVRVDGDAEAMKQFCRDHLIPIEFWQIDYSDGLPDEVRQEYPNLKLPAHIGQINFGELIKSLNNELTECSTAGLYDLQATEEQGLACVKLVKWLLENGRL
jgi:hypothetical protein